MGRTAYKSMDYKKLKKVYLVIHEDVVQTVVIDKDIFFNI